MSTADDFQIRLPLVATLFDMRQISGTNTTPFIKEEYFKSPLENGDSGGCLVYHTANFEIPKHQIRFDPKIPLDGDVSC